MKDLQEFSANDLLLAYTMGIFPMANNCKDPSVTWICPEMRGIIPLNNLHISKSLRRRINSKKYKCSFNTKFNKVLSHCMNREQTWINSTLVERYIELHNRKFAHSVEVWLDNELIGGLFGISIGACFFAESMFSLKPDGSKMALVALVNRLNLCQFKLFDTQFFTSHLGRMGGMEISKIEYEELLKSNLFGNANFYNVSQNTEYLYVPKKNC